MARAGLSGREALRLGRLRLRFSPRDVVAGVSVALVLVPQSLAYAQLAGMPAVRGLYASAFPPLAAAPFSSSPYLQPGPTAVSALLTFGALAPLAVPGSREYVALALLLALVVGVVRIAVGLARSGVIAYLMSQPMLLGFVPAAGILIVASQLPVALGAEPSGGGVLRQAATALAHPGGWRADTVLLSLAAAGLLLLVPRVNPLVPVVLIVIGAGIGYSALAGYDGATVGSISAGFPPVSLHFPWSRLPSLLLPGAVIAILGFAEASSIARTYAAVERRPWNADREFVGQGVANLAAGLTGGFPVGASFSRSALNRLAGARTSFSAVVTGLAVLAFLPAASVLSSLPQAILAAIVIVAVAGLLRLLPLLRLWRYSRPQFAIAWATFAATLALAPHVERAVLIGVGLSIAVHLMRELSFDIDSWVEGGTLHLKPIGVLWFGSARILEDQFVELLAGHSELTRLVVHFDGLGRVDLSGALALRTLLADARMAGLEVSVEDVPPRAHRVVSRVIGRERDPIGGPGG